MSSDNETLVRETLLRLAHDFIELPDAPIDTSRSLQEYGATSLDLVALVSAAMRELKVRVPRERLAELNNVDGLIALFVELKNSATE